MTDDMINMGRLWKFTRWFWSGAHPVRQWRYFVGGARRIEHAKLRAFRLRFAPFALSQAVLGLPWAGAALIAPSSAKSLFLILGAFKVVGGGAIAGALIHRFFPVRADERELRGRTFIGLSRRVAWQNIDSVRERRWLFTSFLLLSSRGEKSTLWLPLFLSEQSEFEQSIQMWLSPDHPLRRFLEERRELPSQSSRNNSCPTS